MKAMVNLGNQPQYRESAPAQNEVAAALLKVDNPSAALPFADHAVELAPDDANARVTRANINYHLGHYQAATDDAQLVLQVDPSNQAAQAVLRLVGGRMGPSDLISRSIKTDLDEGTDSGTGADGGASGAASGPGGGPATEFSVGNSSRRQSEQFRRASIALINQGKLSEAEAEAAKAVMADPGYGSAYLPWVLLALKNGRVDEVIRGATEALEHGLSAKERRQLLDMRAAAFLKKWRWNDAFKDADQAVRLASEPDARAYFNRAQAGEGRGDPADSVLADYRLAAQSAGDDDALQKALASAYDGAMARYQSPGVGAGAASGGVRASQADSRGPSARPETASHGLIAALGLPSLPLPALAAFAFVLFGGGSALVLLLFKRAFPAPVPPPSAGAAGIGAIARDHPIEIGRMIGRGGMGNVYEGRDRGLARKVAVKELRAELQGEPKARERFLQEARTVAQLSHPNIVTIHSVIQTAERTLLVFEFVEGKTLAEILEASPGRRLPMRGTFDVARQVCAALEFAHGRHVIHRDLKPSNIMIEASGRLKVMDFGIARQAKDSLMTVTNTVMGTPYYMAPEMEEGAVGKEGDLYSLAVCLYEMATGALPFEGVACQRLKKEGRFKLPTQIDADFPATLDGFFRQALDPRPPRRPASAAELLRGLSAAWRDPSRAQPA